MNLAHYGFVAVGKLEARGFSIKHLSEQERDKISIELEAIADHSSEIIRSRTGNSVFSDESWRIPVLFDYENLLLRVVVQLRLHLYSAGYVRDCFNSGEFLEGEAYSVMLNVNLYDKRSKRVLEKAETKSTIMKFKTSISESLANLGKTSTVKQEAAGIAINQFRKVQR